MTLVVQQLDETMGRLDKPESLGPYQSLKNALNMLMTDARFGFMFTGGIAMRDNMVPILSRIFRVPVDGKPLTILDLSAVASEITNVVVSVLCRMAFDFAVWSDGEVPVLLVCEEAHRYVPENDRLGFEPTKRALRASPRRAASTASRSASSPSVRRSSPPACSPSAARSSPCA